MKDKLLYQLVKSRQFKRLTKQEQAIELQDFLYQKKEFPQIFSSKSP